MSSYVNSQAVFKFKTVQDYEQARNVLLKGGWINDAGLLTETDYIVPVITQSIAFVKGNDLKLEIRIPRFHYRNITMAYKEMSKFSYSYVTVGTLTDGDSLGWFEVFFNGKKKEKEFDLAKWSKTKLKITAPKFNEEDAEEYLDWQSDTIDSFLDYYEDYFSKNRRKK